MEDLVYFTRRKLGEHGSAVCWVHRQPCPKCKKAKMGKPQKDDGSVKIRATEYVCPSCQHTVPKKAYEESLQVNIQYTCPHCKHEGETQAPYIRKTFQGAKAVVFTCNECKQKIPITKKMKDTKKKGASEGFE